MVAIPRNLGVVSSHVECVLFFGVIEATDFVTTVNLELISTGNRCGNCDCHARPDFWSDGGWLVSARTAQKDLSLAVSFLAH